MPLLALPRAPRQVQRHCRCENCAVDPSIFASTKDVIPQSVPRVIESNLTALQDIEAEPTTRVIRRPLVFIHTGPRLVGGALASCRPIAQDPRP
eukprot:15455069-Alexandrium_andersonii.AAC.1